MTTADKNPPVTPVTNPTASRRTLLKGVVAVAAVGSQTLPSSRVLGANDRIRLGIIGAGGRGKELLATFLSNKEVELVTVADVFSGRHEEAKKFNPSVEFVDDHRKLLDKKDIDAVIVATPLHCHARHFIDTLSAGKDMYAEKTMTWSIGEAEACRKAAQANPKRVVQIGLQNESSPALTSGKKWIKDGLVGKVAQVEAWMSRNTPAGKGQWVRPIPAGCSKDTVRWDAFLNGRKARPFDAQKLINWRLYWEFSGGNVTENFVHQIAWLHSLLSLPLPSSAYMSGGIYSVKDGREVPDTIAITLDYPDMVLTWQSTFSNKAYGLGDRILGSHGTIEHLLATNEMVGAKLRGSIKYLPEKTNRPDGVAINEDLGEDAEANGVHVTNFLSCLKSRKQPNAPVETGYKAAVAAHMANISFRLKQRVTLEEARKKALHGLDGEGGTLALLK